MNDSRRPYFSIVIPTHDRPSQLRRCLEAIAGLDYPLSRYEVVVVDDDSPVPPTSVVDDLQTRLTCRLLRQSHSGPAVARNTGAAVAQGDFLAFLDDDCRPAAGWLTAFADQIDATPEALLGGRTENGLPHNVYAEASQQLVHYVTDATREETKQIHFFTSNNLVVPTELFYELGGFDSSFPLAAGEDRDFYRRWRAKSWQAQTVPEALVWHEHMLTLRKFWRQHVNYGRGARHFRRTAQHRAENVSPRASFYLELIRYALHKNSLPRSGFIAGLLMLSQIATALGFAQEVWKERRRHGGVQGSRPS